MPGRWSKMPGAVTVAWCRRRGRCGSSNRLRYRRCSMQAWSWSLRAVAAYRSSRLRPGTTEAWRRSSIRDLASAHLAASLGLPLLLISTGVERVAVHFRKPDQRDLDRVNLAEVRGYLEAGEFPEGSMGPKIRAAIEFLERGGEEVIITSVGCLETAIAGQAGTHITR